jgi:hypothetical protein
MDWEIKFHNLIDEIANHPNIDSVYAYMSTWIKLRQEERGKIKQAIASGYRSQY